MAGASDCCSAEGPIRRSQAGNRRTHHRVFRSEPCACHRAGFADVLDGAEVHDDPRVRERSFGDWDGHAVSELAERYPEDFRSWMEHRGGEMKYGAEAKEHVGERGVEALRDWSTRAGTDTDLFVFSHGAWIAQTLQTLLGITAVDPTFRR